MAALLQLLLGLLTLVRVRAEYLQEFEIRENVLPGTVIGYIDQAKKGAAHRPPSPPYFVVPVANSDVDTDLVVVTTTGEIRTNITLDRESRDEYSFTAIPSKQGENIRVVIKVLDENDNPPEFPSSSIHVDFAENAPRDAKRTLVPARDRDLGNFSTQYYEIVSGNTNNVFRLSYHRERDDVLYVDLQVNGVLDREITPNCSLIIEAFDGGSPPLKGTLQVNITIQDVNDNQPIFSQGNYVAAIAENATVGTSVLRVLATDTDEGPNGEVRYSINRRQSDRAQFFNIDPKTGEIFVNKPLDFETKENHELVIVARDNGLQPLETTTFVSIRISDINDNTPTISLIFLSDDAMPRVREDAKVGDFVGRISVSDPDSREEYANINVTLHGGDGHFGLTSRDGVIYLMVVKVPLDRERQANFTMTIMATDQGVPPLKAAKLFTLHVSDVNDNAPEFTQREYAANVPEVAEPGFSVIRLQATDPDEGAHATIRYDLQNDVNGWFKIDPVSGVITTKSFIDCETNPNPQLTVVARDKGTPSLSSTAKLTVTVSDVNDNEPLFDQSYYNITVTEDARIGTCVLKVSASDPDCGVNAVVNFTLGPSSSPTFKIDSRTGELCIAGKLDREARAIYEIPVLATDRGGLSTATIVKVHVLDVNDHRPVFTPTVYNVSLYEFYDQTSQPIVVVVAKDRDEGINGQLSYRIVEGNHQLFRIDPHTGGVYVTSTLRRGSGTLHKLMVAAQDGQGLRSEKNAFVYVSVLSERQKPPVFVYPRYVFSVREDVAPRSVIGNVTATTADHGLQGIRYSIRHGNDEGYFSIDAIRGLISVEKALDFETASSVLLSVEAASGLPMSYGHAQVNISILDVNDNSPRFETSLVRMSVPENSSLASPIFFVHAEDADSGENGQVSYSLTGELDNFKVNGGSGAITLKRSLDYELRQQHRLTIIAEDGALPPRSNNMTLLVEVQDINDNAPVFEYTSYRISIDEGMEVDTEFLRVTAADSDSGNNARLTYRLVDSPSTTLNFGIYPNSGYLYLRDKLDRETEDNYIIQIEAVDNGNPPLSASTTVFIAVTDANDNEPQFVRDMFEFAVEENLDSGRLVGEIRAVDKDIGENAIVRYNLLSNFDDFSVNSITGEMFTKGRLDREKRSNYECIVEARDQGPQPKSSRVTVRVKVLDKNDNAPQFVDKQETSFVIRENEPPGSEVAQVRTSDADEGTNAEVVYELEATNQPTDGVHLFAISNDGLVKTKTELSQQSEYFLRVVAKDLGSPSLETKLDIRITVQALNDKLLSYLSSTVTFTVKEGLLPGHEVGIVEAVQQDRDSATGILYTITAGNDFNTFSIDRVTGVLYTNVEIDYEVTSSFTLHVTANANGPAESRSSVVTVNVRVEDTNDNPPQFSSDPVVFSVSENTSPGRILNAVCAIDHDSGLNGEIRYSIIEASGPAKPTFTIDPVSGAITLIEPLDYEKQWQYIFVVEAQDQAREPEARLSGRATVTLLVEDENDNTPEIVSKATVELYEDHPVGTLVTTILGRDNDSRENGRISFNIQGGDVFGNFRLNETTGQVTLQRALSLKQASEIALNVTVRDNGQPMRFSFQTLRVKIRDSADFAPLFQRKVYRADVSEGAPVGSVLVRISARNSTPNWQHNISYTLLNDPSVPFSINSSSGEVSVKRPLDRERFSRYNVTLFADDVTYPTSQHDSAVLIVDVLDINDNVPEFGNSCYNLSVPENRVGSVVHKLHATDNDLDSNGEIIYTIADGNLGNVFSIDPLSGSLSCKSLDRESVPEYALVIHAQDKGAPPKVGICRIWVEVMDQNDNDPQFEHSQYTPQIREDTEIGTEVLMVNAHDIDERNNGQVTYSLINATASLFSIDSETGRIYTTGQFDREQEQSYTLEVRASDKGFYETRSHSATVHIAIIDVNDNKPIFVRYPFFAEIQPDAQIGTHVDHVVAEDDDEGRNSDIIYSFSDSGVHSDYFHIDPQSGEVTLAKLVYRFQGKVLHLEIVASDQGEPPKSSVGVLEVHVGTTSNEYQLQFVKERYTVEISESANYGLEILTVRAEDFWKNSNDISYSLDSDSDEFSINAQSGVVRVNNSLKLDYEHQQSLSAIIIAKSVTGSEPRYGYARLEVNLRNENDNAPRFSQSSYEASVFEGKRRGELVVQVSAIDEDSSHQKLFYQIIDGNHDNAFTIDPPSGGVIKTNTVLDREIRDSYVLVVTASDEMSPPLSGTTTVSITVVDINDNEPVFPAVDLVKVREDSKVGSIVATVEANDVDTFPPLLYTLKNPEAHFNIDSYSGAITLAKPLDYEKQTNYSLTVTVSDGAHSAETAVAIEVLDSNDNAPVFAAPVYDILLGSQPDSRLLTVAATDADSGDDGRVSFYLEPSSSIVKIDEITGDVFLKDDVSLRRTFVSYVGVVARDGGSPAKQTMIPLRLQTSSLAKKPYSFSEKNYTVQVSEAVAIGSQVFSLPSEDAARDPIDLKLSYNICAGNDDDHFIVDDSNGGIILAKRLNREETNSYELHLVAYPFRQQSSVNVSTIVRVEVTDVNDTPPVFVKKRYEVSLSEYTRVGSNVLTVLAEDKDSGSEVHYDITSGNELKHFAIDKVDGSIALMKELDFDKGDQFKFIVRATDARNSVLASLVGVTINVIDENDNTPTFPVSRYNESVLEASPVGTVIFTARASDRDKGHFGSLNYTILEGEAREKFSIDPGTGVVSSNIIFDYESKKHHYFTVVATDAGGKVGHVQVQVDVIGKDEYPPEFLKPVYHFTVPGNAPVGYSIGRVEATDIDSGQDGVVNYWLRYSSPNFNVNATTGVIYVVKPMGPHKRLIEMTLSIEAGTGRQASSTSVTTVQVTIDFSLNATIVSESVSDSSLVGWLLVSLLTCVILILLGLLLFSKYRSTSHDAKPDTAINHIDVCRYPNLTYPPHYNEISHYDTPDEAHMTNAYDKRCVSSRSGGDEDEEIRMINEGRMLPTSNSCTTRSHLQQHHLQQHNLQQLLPAQQDNDVFSAQNTQEYLARLGIYKTCSEKSTQGDYAKIEGGDCDGLSNIIYEKLDDIDDRTVSDRNLAKRFRPPASSLNAIAHCDTEDIGASYNWDYLNDWSPQYHKLPKLFAEMAKTSEKPEHPGFPMAALSSNNSSNRSRRSVIIERLPPTQQRPPPPPPTCASR